MLKTIRAKLINMIGPFIFKYYKSDFEELLKWSIQEQANMLDEAVDKAVERGVYLEIHLDPSTIPMMMEVYQSEPVRGPQPDLTVVQDEPTEE